jgi:putative nucleotidyltransferase with HDIG domain
MSPAATPVCPTPTPPVDVVAAVEHVAPLSPAASRLIGLLVRSGSEPQETVRVVEGDAALTAAVLRGVNSAELRLNRTIKTVSDAVAYLGSARIAGIALALAGRTLFNDELRGYRGSRGDLGRHCLYVALAARELAAHTLGQVDPALAFTAGLLHDIGKAVISDHLAGSADVIVDELDAGRIPDFTTGERDRLGYDHAEIGVALAHHWRLPFALVPPVAHHHAPFDAEPAHQPLACLVHLADMLAYGQGIGTGLDTAGHRLEPRYQHWVVLDEEGMGQVMADVRAAYEASYAGHFGS